MKSVTIIELLIASVVSTSAFAQIPAPKNVRIDTTMNHHGVFVEWDAVTQGIPAGSSVSYNVIRTMRAADPAIPFTDTDTLGVHRGTMYFDYAAMPGPCMTYTYWVETVAKIDDKIVSESSPSDSVQARAGGATNAVVIYPISKTLVAVAGSLFFDTLFACSSDGASLTFSLWRAPDGMTIPDSHSGIIMWNVPVDFQRGLFVQKVIVKDSRGNWAYTFLNINVIGTFVGSIKGNVQAPDDSDETATLKLFNIVSGNTATLYRQSGDFEFDNVESGKYKLFIMPNAFGAQPFWYRNNKSVNTADTIAVTANNTTELEDITLTVPRRFSYPIGGVLRDSRGAIANGTIQAFAVNGFFSEHGDHNDEVFASPPVLYESAEAATGADGSYSLAVDSGATYLLLASAPGHQSQFIGPPESAQAVSPFDAPAITPTNGGTSSYNGTLPQNDTTGQQIVGTVTSDQSNVAGVRAMIMVYEEKAGTITSGFSGGIIPFDVVSSDSAGNFSISSLNRDTSGNASYILQAIPYSGYVPSYFAYNDSVLNKILWEDAKPFQLSPAGGSPVEVNVTVHPMGQGAGTISGMITEPTDSGWQPSVHTFVYAVDKTTMTPAGYAVTDGGGNYTIGNLPRGSYAIYADKIPYKYGSYDPVTLTPDSNVAGGVDFSLETGLTGVAQRFIVPDGAPLDQNFPNPFAGTTAITVTAPAAVAPASLSLRVYDGLGREVADLSNHLRSMTRGATTVVIFSAHALPAGVYFYRLSDNKGVVNSRQMLLIR